MIVVGVDIGGTFTDLMLYDTDSGAVHVHKTPSTPAEPERAMIERDEEPALAPHGVAAAREVVASVGRRARRSRRAA